MSQPIIALRLFEMLTDYTKAIKKGEVALDATSPALNFCVNFYAQFFQNRLGRPIEHFDRAAKEAAVGILLAQKEANGPASVILLITWFEKLCEIYPDVLALSYGAASKTVFFDFNKYLLTLLERISAWAKAEPEPDQPQLDLQQRAEASLDALREALHPSQDEHDRSTGAGQSA